MKENPITDALGEIDPAYIAEAEAAWKIARRPRMRLLPIAALITILVCTVGFTLAGRLYYAPGVGIIDEDSLTALQVWACYDEITLGGAKIDAVVLSEGEEGYNLTVWVWRGEKQNQGEQMALAGEPIKELENFSLLTGGIEYTHKTAAYANPGFTAYSFENIPFTNTVTLCDSAGNTATIRLTTIDKGQYGYLRGIELGEGKYLSVVPVSGSENILAVQLTDPLAEALANYMPSITINGKNVLGTFSTTRDDGTEGHASGTLMLSGVNTNQFSLVKVSNEDVDAGIAAIAPKEIEIHYTIYDTTDKLPHITLKVPAHGEGYDCSEVLFDAAGIVIHLVHVKRGENGLQFTTEIENKTGSSLLQTLRCSVHNANHAESGRKIQYDKKTDSLYVHSGFDENGSPIFATVETGEEIIVRLGSLHLTYAFEALEPIKIK